MLRWWPTAPFRVPSHVGAKWKAENEQTITELLWEERNLKIFWDWLFGFCFAFYAHMGQHPETIIGEASLPITFSGSTRFINVEIIPSLTDTWVLSLNFAEVSENEYFQPKYSFSHQKRDDLSYQKNSKLTWLYYIQKSKMFPRLWSTDKNEQWSHLEAWYWTGWLMQNLVQYRLVPTTTAGPRY